MKLLVIEPCGAMAVRCVWWGGSDEFTASVDEWARLEPGVDHFDVVGVQHRPGIGLITLWLEGPDFPDNPLASELCQAGPGPVGVCGFVPDNEFLEEGERAMELGDFEPGGWDYPYLPVDVPDSFLARAADVWFQFFQGRKIKDLP